MTLRVRVGNGSRPWLWVLRGSLAALVMAILLAVPTPGCGNADKATVRRPGRVAGTGGTGPGHTGTFVTPEEFAAAVRDAGAVARRLHDLDGAREREPRPDGAGSVLAAVVPHHVVASRFAAGLLSYLSENPPGILVIVGPDHRGSGPPVGTSSAAWETSEGLVEADAELVSALLGSGLAAEARAAQDGEHSIGVFMPFVRHYLPATRVVPLTLRGELPLDRAAALGRFVRAWADRRGATAKEEPGRPVFLLASVDFSHYLPAAEAEARDVSTVAALRNGEWGTLFTMGSAHLDSPAALAAAFAFAGSLNAPVFTVAEHANSATILGRLDLEETTSYFLMTIP